MPQKVALGSLSSRGHLSSFELVKTQISRTSLLCDLDLSQSMITVLSLENDDFFFGGGPLPDEKPKTSVKQGATPQLSVTGKPTRVTGRIQVSSPVGHG